MSNSFPTDKPAIHKAPVARVQPVSNRKPRRAAKAEEESRQITPMALLHAFRRRWIPAVAVAIPAALLAAVAVWELIPAPFESYAIVKVLQRTPTNTTLDQGGWESDFLHYRDSQMAYIKSRPVLESALRKPEVSQTETVKVLKYPVEFLEEALKVASMESDEFVRISLNGDRPRELATIVNAVKDSYMNEVVYAARNQKSKQLETLKNLLGSKEDELRKLQTHVDELAEGLGTTDSRAIAVKIKLLEQDLTEFRRDLRDVKDDLTDEERRRNARIRAGLPPDSMVPVDVPRAGAQGGASNPILSEAQRAAQLSRFIERMKGSLAPGRSNESLKRAERELAALKTGRGPEGPAAVMSHYQGLLERKTKLEKQISETSRLIDDNNRKSILIERESKGVARLEKVIDEFESQVTALDAEIGAPARVSVVHDANVPEVRNVKTRSRLAVIGALGMFALVIGGFTLVEWMSQRIASPAELTAETNLRLLGSLPAPERPGVLGKLGLGEPNLHEWNRVLVESVDVVRTYLLRHMQSDEAKSIVVASASANEGKTTLSTQLGSSIARSGRRVCVVDCDFRRPSAHLVFQAEQGSGVSELLRGQADVESITRETSIPGLFFISAGEVDNESLRVLAMDGGEQLIATLKQHFDFVIIDTSPILFVAEPSMMAQHSDAIVLAVRRDYSRLGFVNQACETLRNLDAPLVGAVMVGAESSIHRQTYGYQQDIRFAEPQSKQVSSVAAG